MSKLFHFLVLLFLNSNIYGFNPNTEGKANYSLLESADSSDKEIAQHKVTDSLYMMGYKTKISHKYTLVLMNNSPVKLVYTEEKESQKGTFVQMLNQDSLIFQSKTGSIDTIAMNTLKFIRTDYTRNKILGGASTLVGVGLLYIGNNYMQLDPKLYGRYIKVLGGVVMVAGVLYIAYVPYLVLHHKFKPESKYYGTKK